METFPNNGLVDGDEKSKAKLFKFLDGIQPRGGTVPEIACEHAFEKIVKRQQVDTIYRLSDGAPNNPPARSGQSENRRSCGRYLCQDSHRRLPGRRGCRSAGIPQEDRRGHRRQIRSGQLNFRRADAVATIL